MESELIVEYAKLYDLLGALESNLATADSPDLAT